MKKKAVTILLHDEHGRILGVSRKNDHSDIGLPGGKCDPGEADELAIVREVLEETGLKVYDVRSYFTRDDAEFSCTTYIGNYSGEISTNESGVVKWIGWDQLENGSFGEYNKLLHQHFNNTHKYTAGDVVLNQDTSEVFMIIMAVPGDKGSVAGYFVKALFSETGYAFVKKSAIDGVRMTHAKIGDKESELILESAFNHDIKVSHFYSLSSHFDVNQYYGEGDSMLYSYHVKRVVDVGRRFKHLIPSDAWDYVEDGLWVHDLIEDARKTWNDIRKSIGELAANFSFALANSTGKTRDERADIIYYEKLRRTRYATFIKLSDRIANVEYSLSQGSSMGKKYREEFDKFVKELYVPGEYDEMWNHLDKLLG